MSKVDDKPDVADEVIEAQGARSAHASSFSRRRRLIKLSASAVPVAMTLTSRPVMAWHCNTTSAWGSAQMAGNVGSAQTRLTGGVVNGNECWYISNWVSNTIYTGASSFKPWLVLANARYSSVSGWNSKTETQKFDYAKANCVLSNIFPLGCSAIGSGGGKVWDTLQGTDSFKKSVIVARLNTLYTNSAAKTVINACVVSNGTDQIQEMARLGASYTPPNGTIPWTKAQIVTYLNSNYLARS
jgi:hypothetical protein